MLFYKIEFFRYGSGFSRNVYIKERNDYDMSERYVLAYDLGTSGVKAALVTLQGEVKYTATAGYPLYTPQVNWAEQDPQLYWEGVCTATKQGF